MMPNKKQICKNMLNIPGLGVVISTVIVAVVTEFLEGLVDIIVDFVGEMEVTVDDGITDTVGVLEKVCVDETLDDGVGDTEFTETLGDNDNDDDEVGCDGDTV